MNGVKKLDNLVRKLGRFLAKGVKPIKGSVLVLAGEWLNRRHKGVSPALDKCGVTG